MTKRGLGVDITIEAGDWAKALPEASRLSKRAVKAVCAALEGVPEWAEVSVLLTDDAHQRVLNRDWRGKDKATNVLSFPGDFSDETPPGAPVLLGDIAVAFETTQAEAQDQQKSLADHFCHLVVHGMLHLLGFDHVKQADANEMEPLEIEILEGLGIASPYPDRDEAKAK
jgi:probable rRNA maturation factor